MKTSPKKKPGHLDPAEWDFSQVKAGLESPCLRYETLREIFPHASGVTLECLKANWPWWPRPWLSATNEDHAKIQEPASSGFEVVPEALNLYYPPEGEAFPRKTAPSKQVFIVRDKFRNGQLTTDHQFLMDAGVADPEYLEDGTPILEGEPRQVVVATVMIDRSKTLEELTEAFRRWIKPALISSKEPPIREKTRVRLIQFGAWRVARHLAGGGDDFEFAHDVLARCQTSLDRYLEAGDKLGTRANGDQWQAWEQFSSSAKGDGRRNWFRAIKAVREHLAESRRQLGHRTI